MAEEAGTPSEEDAIAPEKLAETTPEWEKVNMPKGFAHAVVSNPKGELRGKAYSTRLAAEQLLAHGDIPTLLVVLYRTITEERGPKNYDRFEYFRDAAIDRLAEESDAWAGFKEFAKRAKQPTLTVIVKEVPRYEGSQELVKVYELELATAAFRRIETALRAHPIFGDSADEDVQKAKGRKAHLLRMLSEVGLNEDVTHKERVKRARSILGAPWNRLDEKRRLARDIVEAIVFAAGKSPSEKPRKVLLAARRISRLNDSADQEALLEVLDSIIEQDAKHGQDEARKAKYAALLWAVEHMSNENRTYHPQEFVGEGYEATLQDSASRLIRLARIHKDPRVKAKADSVIGAYLLAAKLGEVKKEEETAEDPPAGT